jgi:hypothetical protein
VNTLVPHPRAALSASRAEQASASFLVDLPLKFRISRLNFHYGSKQVLFEIDLGIAANRITALNEVPCTQFNEG